jgi:hypothetical protein
MGAPTRPGRRLPPVRCRAPRDRAPARNTHDFTLPGRRQSRRTDVRLHQRELEDQEWIDLRGLPVTRPSRIYGHQQRPSTRYKDLVDLVSISTGASVAAGPQLTALASEAERRGIVFPTRLDIPDRRLWEPGYAAEAGRSLLPVGRTLTEALTIVRAFADPLLDKTAAGTWDPNTGRWRSRVHIQVLNATGRPSIAPDPQV